MRHLVQITPDWMHGKTWNQPNFPADSFFHLCSPATWDGHLRSKSAQSQFLTKTKKFIRLFTFYIFHIKSRSTASGRLFVTQTNTLDWLWLVFALCYTVPWEHTLTDFPVFPGYPGFPDSFPDSFPGFPGFPELGGGTVQSWRTNRRTDGQTDAINSIISLASRTIINIYQDHLKLGIRSFFQVGKCCLFQVWFDIVA